MRSIVSIALAMLVGLAGCGAPPSSSEPDEKVGDAESAIQGGYLDAADEATLGLAVTDSNGYLVKTCSGVLVAPNLAITAQHCVADTSKFVSCDSSTFGPPAEASQVFVTTSSTMWSGSTVWHAAREVMIPPGGDAVCGRDIALLVLSDVLTDEATPITPRLDPEVASEETYSAIGYGASDGTGDDAGIRRRRDGLTVACVGGDCATNQVDGREWRGLHGICNGDSGGPAIDEAGEVVGITSRGPTGCDDPIYGGLPAHRDFLTSSAAHAAKLGRYETPKWAGGDGEDMAPADQKFSSDWSSCSMRAARGSAGGAWPLALLIACGIWRARSRRSCSLRRSSR